MAKLGAIFGLALVRLVKMDSRVSVVGVEKKVCVRHSEAAMFSKALKKFCKSVFEFRKMGCDAMVPII